MRRIGIVGAGFCGTMVAAHLLRSQQSGGMEVHLINRPPPTGTTTSKDDTSLARGLAYGTRSPHHVLNVPAARMSAWPQQPNDFVDFLNASGLPATGGDFVPRDWYGRYLQHTLSEAARVGDAIGNVLVHHRADVAAMDVGRPPMSLRFTDGGTLELDRVILALGNFAPGTPIGVNAALRDSPQFINDPWHVGALDHLDTTAPILLIGSGLTMVDVALSLATQHARRGSTSPMRLRSISRRGLTPHSHRENAAPPAPLDTTDLMRVLACPTTRTLVSATRQLIDRLSAQGTDWRDVIAALRPHTPALWAQLSELDRRRFLRHLRPFWEVHRHRAAPAIARRIEAMLATGELSIRAARLRSLEHTRDGLVAHLQPRGSSEVDEIRVGYAINCTGPSDELSAEPLLQALLAEGNLCRDALGIGLQVDDSYRVRKQNGRAHDDLFYVGPLLKAQFWEATAVPELRGHAARAAESLLR